jgi:hypothetical protein
MRITHWIAVLSWSALLAGLAVAYASTGVGLAGLVDVRTASLAVILGSGVAVAALIAHFLAALQEIRHHERDETAHLFR